ncbi:hypothetical protein [Dyadobacter sandarakinus]|uniref:Uncharacterized protein n=1 Tax=Dyadobacter sandarakinus TaxID=2747268 RepID=A0ABX7IB42_9BACT|nr:hypothetical protein [Dyadobacter sandarakinus]QRR02667.1 hypothetical protein HWI92_17980 [Dyadobacter sandarakinus]
MKFLLMVLISAAAQVFLPWWVIAVVPFVVQLALPRVGGNAFWGSFLAIGLVWGAYGFYLHYVSNGAMSDRIARTFFLPNGWLMLVVTVLLGGLVAGFAGLSGYLVRRIFEKTPVTPEL